MLKKQMDGCVQPAARRKLQDRNGLDTAAVGMTFLWLLEEEVGTVHASLTSNTRQARGNEGGKHGEGI